LRYGSGLGGVRFGDGTVRYLACRSRARSAPVLICSSLIAFGAAPDVSTAEMCETPIIATFSEDQGSRPDDGFVTDLARSADVHLTFLRLAGPGLYVFTLSATDPDPNCREALERLRRDTRVRSVDKDMRRKAHA
jgi:hypothetical protein